MSIKNVLVIGSSGVGKKNWVNNLTGVEFEPRYLPLKNVSQHEVNYNNTTFNISIVPGQMPYLIDQCVTLFNGTDASVPDYVLVFVDVTSRLSNKKGLILRHRMEELGIPVHLVYNKSDVPENRLEEMTQNLQCGTYSVISGRKGENVHAPLMWTCVSF